MLLPGGGGKKFSRVRPLAPASHPIRHSPEIYIQAERQLHGLVKIITLCKYIQCRLLAMTMITLAINLITICHRLYSSSMIARFNFSTRFYSGILLGSTLRLAKYYSGSYSETYENPSHDRI